MKSFSRYMRAPLLVLALAASSHAQQPPPPEEQPFVEPSERHRHFAEAETRELDTTAVNPVTQGRWRTLASTMPINPIHVTLMRTGKVLVVAGSGKNVRDTQQFMVGEWDPATETIRTFRVAWDMFCNGMVTLPDGRPMVFGGTIAYDSPGVNFKGEPRASAYRPFFGNFVDLPRMRRGRWYPTGTVLSDGTVMVISGFNEQGFVTQDVEIYRPATNSWVLAGTAFPRLPLYPRQHLLPSGKVFVSGSNALTKLWTPATRTWVNGPTTRFGKDRDYGTSVLLPLTPANGFRPRVMLLGGGPRGGDVTATTELVDLSNPDPAAWVWRFGPNMKQPRIQLNATLLPNGQVLVSGGSTQDEIQSTAVLATELFDPVSNTFRDGAPMRFARLYHSNTLLLQDGTVLAVGSNPSRSYQQHIEIYSPPYLFTSTGALAPRPAITSAPVTVGYGGTFAVQTPNAAAIRSVVLIRPGAPTHAFDMEQRLVGVNFTAGAGVLNVVAPANGSLAPPGFYLLFIIDANGVPSVGRFVQVA